MEINSNLENKVEDMLMTEIEENLSGSESSAYLNKYLARIDGYKHNTSKQLKSATSADQQKALSQLQKSWKLAGTVLVPLKEQLQARDSV